MKKWTIGLLIGISLLASLPMAYAAKCSQTGVCTACKNCANCKNCSERGGSCSVCRRRDTPTKPDEEHKHEDREQSREEK